MKRGGPLHPKTFALAEALGKGRAHAVGTLELLFHFTAQYCPAGDVGRYEDKRIAAALDWGGSPAKLLGALVSTRWLDRHPTARLVLHDWAEHVDRTVSQRMKRQGKTMIQPSQLDTAEVCTHADTASEEKSVLPVPEPKPEPEPDEPQTHFDELAERMYGQHPNKAGRILFEQALAGVLSAAVDPAMVAARIERTHAAWLPIWERDSGKYAPRLDRWILGSGFMDDPPAAEEGKPAASEYADDYQRRIQAE